MELTLGGFTSNAQAQRFRKYVGVTVIYELKGQLLEQSLAWLEDCKTWVDTVVNPFLKEYANPDTCRVSLTSHPMMKSAITGVFSTEPLDKPWLESKQHEGYYYPSKRSKAGKQLIQVINDLPCEPDCDFLYKALGFEDTYFHVSGNTYGSIPISVHGKLGKAFIKWYENYPEISHPDLVEITHTEYGQIVGKD